MKKLFIKSLVRRELAKPKKKVLLYNAQPETVLREESDQPEDIVQGFHQPENGASSSS
jgi:hypothetical protein